jgi:hypothetical protein
MNEQSTNKALEAASNVGGPAFLIIFIIVVAGLIGGWGAYLTQLEDSPPPDSPKPQPTLRRFCVLGVIASACVPLFLSLVQSKLLEDPFDKVFSKQFTAYLVFAGLCLIAAFSARAFIDSISRRVLQQVEQIKDRQAEVEEKVAVNSEKIDDQKAEPVSEDDHAAEAAAVQETPPTIGDPERRMLEALARKSYRTVSGIVEDSDLDRNVVLAQLRELAKKSLAVPTTSKRSGGLRWMITPLGRASLRS